MHDVIWFFKRPCMSQSSAQSLQNSLKYLLHLPGNSHSFLFFLKLFSRFIPKKRKKLFSKWRICLKMASPNEKDDVPMLPISSSSSRTRSFTSRFRSTSLANTSSAIDGFDSSNVVLGYTGPLQTYRRPAFVQMSASLPSTLIPEPLFLHPTPTGGSSHSIGVSSSQPESCPFAALEHKNSDDELGLRSGQLEVCNDPYCTTCPSYYNPKPAQIPPSKVQ